jgi:hypothetical protein
MIEILCSVMLPTRPFPEALLADCRVCTRDAAVPEDGKHSACRSFQDLGRLYRYASPRWNLPHPAPKTMASKGRPAAFVTALFDAGHDPRAVPGSTQTRRGRSQRRSSAEAAADFVEDIAPFAHPMRDVPHGHGRA